MKIVQIGSFPLTDGCVNGGVEASVYGLTLIQAQRNQVFVLDFPRRCYKVDKLDDNKKYQVFRFKLPHKNNISSLLRVRDYYKQIEQIKPDVCHLHGSSVFVFFLYRYLVKKGVKCIITIHGLVHVEKRKLLKSKFNFKIYIQYLFQSWAEFSLVNQAKIMIVDTEYVKRTIKGYKDSNKINHLPELFVIPQGIDESYFEISQNKEKSDLILLSVGAYVERKGHQKLIESFAKLSRENTAVKLKIVGVQTDVQYYNKLKNMLTQYNLNDRVELLHNVAIEELMSLYDQASIFVLHTSEESQGIVFCEAMAAGLPIVATNVGGVPDVITPAANGFLIENGDIIGFNESIQKLLNDPVLCAEIAENNLIASRRYSWANINNEIELIYSQLD